MKQGLNFSFIDIEIGNSAPTIRNAKRFEDISVYSESTDLSNLNREQKILEELLHSELDDSNDIVGMTPSLV